MGVISWGRERADEQAEGGGEAAGNKGVNCYLNYNGSFFFFEQRWTSVGICK